MKQKNTKTNSAKNIKYDYKEILVAQIENLKHQLLVASFFSGVGGFDKGARRAGFQSIIQSDWEIKTGRAFEQNIPWDSNCNIHELLQSEGIFLAGKRTGDITKMNFSDIQKYVKDHLKLILSPGDLSVIIGGPPCQDYSKCNNHRNINGWRNQLIFPYLRMIAAAKPKVALVEQVPDVLCEKFFHIWCRIKLELNTMKDYIWDYRIMNAMNYGGRQNRKRLIIMLVRRDLGVPVSFPEPTSPDLTKVAVQSLLPDVYNFSPGQFSDDIKSAKDNVFCTMTATGSEYFYGIDGVRRKPTMKERLVLTELEGLNLKGIGETAQKKMVGNMVQLSLSEALFNHIKREILKVVD